MQYICGLGNPSVQYAKWRVLKVLDADKINICAVDNQIANEFCQTISVY